MNFKAVKLLRELYFSNRMLCRVTKEAEVSMLVDVLKQPRKLPRYLDMLQTMCVCDGSPMPVNQSRVLRLLLESKTPLLHTARVERDAKTGAFKDVIVTPAESGAKEFRLSGFKSASNDMSRMSPDAMDDRQLQFMYYLTMLRLFCSCSQGRNRDCIDKLVTHGTAYAIDYLDLLGAMSSPAMPNYYREKCCQLMRALYIDREPLKPMSRVQFVRPWACVRDGMKDVLPAHTIVDPWQDVPEA